MKMSLFISLLVIFSNLFIIGKANAVQGDSTGTIPVNEKPRVFQVSFVPYFGTNGLQSADYINVISFNILGGYNGGTNGFELGGLVNVDKYDVKATQIAGIGNANGGETKGVQIGGVFNITQSITGTQIGGISNFAKNIHGVQIGGIVNYNYSGKCVQIGGVVNSTDDRALFQVAGLVNRARVASGSQIAGLVNISQEVTGSQISGLVNIASHIRGTQIGVINFADTCEGIPIGLINIVKNGYMQFELSADEFFLTNLAFRSGVQKFHTTLLAGIQPHHIGSPLWTYGIGVGTSQAVSAKSLIDFDVTFQHMVRNARFNNNHLCRFYLGLDRAISPHLSLAFGLTYNFLVTDLDSHRELFSDIQPYTFTDRDYSHFNVKTWAGFKVGLRFQ